MMFRRSSNLVLAFRHLTNLSREEREGEGEEAAGGRDSWELFDSPSKSDGLINFKFRHLLPKRYLN